MRPLTIFETNLIHASDVIYWVDGTTASDPARMERLTTPVVLRLDTRPFDLQLLHTKGKTALWRRSGGRVVDGTATEVDKALPAAAPYGLAGSVYEPEGRYNPRLFNITAGGAGGHRIVLYPSPLGSCFSKAGGLNGTLRWSTTEFPVPWAVLTLVVTTALAVPLVFRTQADQWGDFMLSLKRLPPLPEGIDHYDAVLTLSAPTVGAGAVPVDPADLTAARLGSPDSAGTFADSIALTIVFGEIRLLQTFDRDFLAVQPS